MRVLVVEDDPLLGDGIRAGLRQEGIIVDLVDRAERARLALDAERFDLMVLDLGLPDRDGLTVLRDLRARNDAIPVLILTARDALDERVRGLDSGADDYLVKPFDLAELGARARALVRRSFGRASPTLQVGELALDPSAHVVSYHGERLNLSPREFTLLQVLMEHAGRVVSKTRLQESIYGWGDEVESNALEVHVHHLRRKLGSSLIQTVRGVGYLLEAC